MLTFADGLRAGGHTVHTPDLSGGQLPASLEDGSAPADTLGPLIAQRLAQTRPGARGAFRNRP
ncbi:hypothetical protein ACQP00_16470 [Dactylosporangium sp. CS-047395]|uniref:hypothetical protein n=1 Tax=Dactylosporangium sp. CS-047395 TaxID=3239936 RepID=UPI003D91972F